MINIKSFYFNPFEECCTLAWDESAQAVIVDPGCITDAESAELVQFISEKGLRPVLIVLTHAHFDHVFGVSALAARYGVPVVMDPADRVVVENNKWFCMNFGLPVPDNSFAEGKWQPYSEWAAGAKSESAGDSGPLQGAAAGNAGQSQFAKAEETVKAKDAGANNAESQGKAARSEYCPIVLTVGDGSVIEWGNGRKWEVLSTPGHTPGGVCYLDREAKLLLSGDTLFAGAIGRTDNRWGDYDALIRGIFSKLMVLDGDITVIPGHGGYTTIADERTKNPFLMPFNEEYKEEED